MKTNVLSKQIVWEFKLGSGRTLFSVIKLLLEYQKFDGSTGTVTRYVFERGDSASAVVYDSRKNMVILTKQLRVPAMLRPEETSDPWLLELPAGMVEKMSTLETMNKELLEEIGYKAYSITKILHSFFLSPGGTSEMMSLYFAQVSTENPIGPGGGLGSENEDIQTIIIPLEKALEMIDSGEIIDAKTIVGLQWLWINQNRGLVDVH